MNRRSMRLSIAIFLSVFAATMVAYVLVDIHRLGCYEASCVVFAENNQVAVVFSYNNQSPISDQENEAFYEYQCIKIVAPEILNPVIAKLRLQEVGPVTIPAAYSRLRAQLSVRPLPKTGCIKITVRNQKRDQAIAIANAVGDEYVRVELESRQQSAARGLAMMQRLLLNEQTRVAQLSQRVERLSQGLPGTVPHDTSTDTNYDAMSLDQSRFMLEQEQRLYEGGQEGVELSRRKCSELAVSPPVRVISRATDGSASSGPFVLMAIRHGAAVGTGLGALSVLAAKMVILRRTRKQAA
jgi:capsular polysaccharide biosynthesis protein